MKRTLLLIGLLALCGLAFGLSLHLNVDPAGATGATRGAETAPLLDPGVPALNYLPVRCCPSAKSAERECEPDAPLLHDDRAEPTSFARSKDFAAPS